MPTNGTGGHSVSSPAVTAVAMAHFVFGGMNLACCVLAALELLVWINRGEHLLGRTASPLAIRLESGILGAVSLIRGKIDPQFAVLLISDLVYCVIEALLPIPMILAGVGLKKGRRWSRVLTIILGGLVGVQVASSLVSVCYRRWRYPLIGSFIFVVMPFSYGALVFGIRPKYPAEFS